MVNNSATHLWFMYPLIGMLISTPFLAKMFQTMKDQEIEIFFLVAILWNIVSIYLTLDIGVGFSYSGWILSGYIIYYFAGYFCKRIINDNNKKIMYTLGIIGFIVSVFGRQF